MAMDALQDKIRKLKNPSVIDFAVEQSHLPPHLLQQEESYLAAYARFCRELLSGLKGVVPAVRFSFSSFALLGPKGLETLSKLLCLARQEGYYVILDAPAVLSPWDAKVAADVIWSDDSSYFCDAMIISGYIGSDSIKPFISGCKAGKALFVVIRSANKSASELQDLLTGSRHVHDAAADIVNRFAETLVGKTGYGSVAALASAGAAASLRTLRTKYNRVFLLVDGLDYPSGNAKNCSNAFDRFGHGAAVCAGPSVTAAWLEAQTDGSDYVEQALQAAQKMKKNLTRYVTVL